MILAQTDNFELIYDLLKDDKLQIWTLIATLLSTLLWGVYVFFTIKTFNQIKRQTDLQSRAFLMATPVLCPLIPDPILVDKAKEIQSKWKRILENNISNSITENRILQIELTNRGKSDIVNWSIEFTIKIEEGEYLNSKFGISGETSNYLVNSKAHQTIAPDQTIKVPIIIVGDFPSAEFKWKITYKDLMEGQYNLSSKGNGFSNKNLMALNFKEEE